MFKRKAVKTGIPTARQIVQNLNLSGKVFVITGAYSGLGAATTKALLTTGAKVIVAGRNPKLQEKFAQELTTSQHANAEVFDASLIDATHTLDLGSLTSVRDFANYVKTNYDRIDCLINNAGVMNTTADVTKDGFEIQMGTNVIGHFLLAKILAEVTKRQVWLSSMGHALIGKPPNNHDYTLAPHIDLDIIRKVDKQTYDGWKRYQQSKLGDILLSKQFPIEYKHLQSCAVHPGVVRTNLGRHLSLWSLIKFVIAGFSGGQQVVSPEQGARTQTLCAVMPDEELVNGAYYANCTVSQAADCAKNMDDAKKLYDYCDQVTKRFQG